MMMMMIKRVELNLEKIEIQKELENEECQMKEMLEERDHWRS